MSATDDVNNGDNVRFKTWEKDGSVLKSLCKIIGIALLKSRFYKNDLL